MNEPESSLQRAGDHIVAIAEYVLHMGEQPNSAAYGRVAANVIFAGHSAGAEFALWAATAASQQWVEGTVRGAVLFSPSCR